MSKPSDKTMTMSGSAWIIIGVIGVALAAFAIPYGFYKKSKQNVGRDAANLVAD